MADSKLINTQDTYEGIYPTVFKKIDSADIMISPFQTNKLWTVLSGSVTTSCLPLNAIYTDTIPALGSELTYNDASNLDGSLQTVTYYSINHLYYKYKDDPTKTYGPTDLNRTKKHLYQSESVLSFPYKKIGEGIKPASFTLTGSFSGSINSLKLHSDRYGNLYNSAFLTESIVTGVKFYEGFNEYFDTSKITYESNNVTYVPGVTGNYNYAGLIPLGLAAQFTSNDGYIKTTLPGEYSRDTDYAISFWIDGAEIYGVPFSGSRTIIAKASGSNVSQYPFKIEVKTDYVSGYNQIVFSAKGGTQLAQISESIFNTGWTHFTCQKTGSRLEIHNGIYKSGSFSFLTNTYNPLEVSARIDNDHPLMIGGTGTVNETLSGSIDEIRIFNRALTNTEISYLGDSNESNQMSFLQTAQVGNVFSKQGIVVISSLDYRFHDILQQPYTASYKSTVTTHELSVIAKLDAGDFNMSTNATLTQDNDVTYHSFVSGSDFAPYMTTIGLYDDAGQLLAIGKLAQPIQKRNDVDMNFLIRIDLDKNISFKE